MPAQKRKISRYWILVGSIIAVFLAVYFLAEALHVPLFTDASVLADASLLTALFGIGLLTLDVLLPVPSSLVMVAHGALFGVIVGSVVSLIGNVLGFLFAYWLGSRSSSLIQKFVPAKELDRGNNVLRKWGTPALILTRPLPILAETTMIMAGVSRLPFAKSLSAVIVGSLPISLLYAWAGSQAKDFNATAVIFLALICLAAVAWKIDKHLVSFKNEAKRHV